MNMSKFRQIHTKMKLLSKNHNKCVSLFARDMIQIQCTCVDHVDVDAVPMQE